MVYDDGVSFVQDKQALNIIIGHNSQNYTVGNLYSIKKLLMTTPLIDINPCYIVNSSIRIEKSVHKQWGYDLIIVSLKYLSY